MRTYDEPFQGNPFLFDPVLSSYLIYFTISMVVFVVKRTGLLIVAQEYPYSQTNKEL